MNKTILYVHKPLTLKTKEILNVEPQCYTKDVEKATSLICTFLKSVDSIPMLKTMEVGIFILKADNLTIVLMVTSIGVNINVSIY